MSEICLRHGRPLLSRAGPFRRPTFRQLWLGMTTSYAGDRLQGLAQAWLVAMLSGSALGVGLISAAGSVGQLLLPLGGVVAERVDRQRALVVGQAIGAASTTVVAFLAVTGLIAPWHVYSWALLAGLVNTVCRPAYKVVLTQVVPEEEVRPAVAANSVTEISAQVSVNALGGLLLAMVGLPIAFVLNVASYLVSIAALKSLPRPESRTGDGASLEVGRLLADLADGLRYLARRPVLLHPLLLTFAGFTLAAPMTGLLPAIVQRSGGSVRDLGLLLAAGGVGGLGGGIYAGARSEGRDPILTYSLRGLVCAVAVCLFALAPTSVFAALPLATAGFLAASAIVWNTSRVARCADPRYQSRLQAITSMAAGLGAIVGLLWAGAAVDRFGPIAILAGGVALGILSGVVALRTRRGI